MKESKMQAITRVGVLIALMMAVQWLTGYMEPFAYITDSCLNCILVAAALMSGLWCGIAAAVLSPICAFILGMGPDVIQVVPAAALGNCILVILSCVLMGKKTTAVQKIISVAVCALMKFIVLYCAVVKVVIPVMGPALPAAQAAVLSETFSWPQLVTALIGTAAAVLLVPILRKISKK